MPYDWLAIALSKKESDSESESESSDRNCGHGKGGGPGTWCRDEEGETTDIGGHVDPKQDKESAQNRERQRRFDERARAKRREEEREAVSDMSEEERQREKAELHRKLDDNIHRLQDIIDGKFKVGVESSGGADYTAAQAAGLYVTNVRGVGIFAQNEEDAAPLVRYLERGGAYGTPQFSRLLGYTDDQIKDYERWLSLAGRDDLLSAPEIDVSAAEEVSSTEQLPEADVEEEEEEVVEDSRKLDRDVARANLLQYGRIWDADEVVSSEREDRLSKPDVSFGIHSISDKYVVTARKSYIFKNPFGHFEAYFDAETGESFDDEYSAQDAAVAASRSYSQGEKKPDWQLMIDRGGVNAYSDGDMSVYFRDVLNGGGIVSYRAEYTVKDGQWRVFKTDNDIQLLASVSDFKEARRLISSDALKIVKNWRRTPPRMSSSKLRAVAELEASLPAANDAWNAAMHVASELGSDTFAKNAELLYARERLSSLGADDPSRADLVRQEAALTTEFRELSARHEEALNRRNAARFDYNNRLESISAALREAQKPVVAYLKTLSYSPATKSKDALDAANRDAAMLGLTKERLDRGGRNLMLQTLRDLADTPSEKRDQIRTFANEGILTMPGAPDYLTGPWSEGVDDVLSVLNPNLLADPALASIEWNFTREARRASACAEANSILLTGDSSQETVAHEFAHHIGFRNSAVHARLNEWAWQRVVGTAEQNPTQLEGYPEGEVAYRDRFADGYVGRYYSENPSMPFHEVISMGVAALFSDRWFNKLLRDDPEHLMHAWAVCRGL